MTLGFRHFEIEVCPVEILDAVPALRLAPLPVVHCQLTNPSPVLALGVTFGC